MFDSDSPCAVCDRGVGAEAAVGFDYLGDDLGELSRFSDGVAHARCLDGWPQKHAFVAAWNEALRAAGVPRLLVVTPDGSVAYRAVGPWRDAGRRLLDHIWRRGSTRRPS